MREQAISRRNAFRHCVCRCPETVQPDHGLAAAHKARWKGVLPALTALAEPCFPPICETTVTSGEIGLTAGAEGATAPETLRQTDRVTSDIWKETPKGFARRRPPTG